MAGLVVTSKRARRTDFDGHSDGTREKKCAYFNWTRVHIKLPQKRVVVAGWIEIKDMQQVSASFDNFWAPKQNLAKKFACYSKPRDLAPRGSPSPPQQFSSPVFTRTESRL
jgi:hypothetical protein